MEHFNNLSNQILKLVPVIYVTNQMNMLQVNFFQHYLKLTRNPCKKTHHSTETDFLFDNLQTQFTYYYIQFRIATGEFQDQQVYPFCGLLLGLLQSKSDAVLFDVCQILKHLLKLCQPMLENNTPQMKRK
jgi:hypothetical protein